MAKLTNKTSHADPSLITYRRATIHLCEDHLVIWPKTRPHRPRNKIYSNFVTFPIECISYPHRMFFSLHQRPCRHSPCARWLYSVPRWWCERYHDCKSATPRSCLRVNTIQIKTVVEWDKQCDVPCSMDSISSESHIGPTYNHFYVSHSIEDHIH